MEHIKLAVIFAITKKDAACGSCMREQYTANGPTQLNHLTYADLHRPMYCHLKIQRDQHIRGFDGRNRLL